MGHASECQLLRQLGAPSFHLKIAASLTMLHLSDSDESDHDETPTFRYDSDPFNTLPDELVLKIIKTVLNNVGDEVHGDLKLMAPRKNYLVKVVRDISPRYVGGNAISLVKQVPDFRYNIGLSSSPPIKHFGKVMW